MQLGQLRVSEISERYVEAWAHTDDGLVEMSVWWKLSNRFRYWNNGSRNFCARRGAVEVGFGKRRRAPQSKLNVATPCDSSSDCTFAEFSSGLKPQPTRSIALGLDVGTLARLV
jgi:hypothetical protein